MAVVIASENDQGNPTNGRNTISNANLIGPAVAVPAGNMTNAEFEVHSSRPLP